MRLLFILSFAYHHCNAFIITSPISQRQIQQTHQPTTSTSLYGKKPQRLEENSSGPLYVNSACINCAACSSFAPFIFSRSPSDNYHIVHKQPSSEKDIEEARAALAACPVSAIRITTSAELNHANKGHRLSEEEEVLAKNMAINERVNGLAHPFPRPLFLSGDDNNDEEKENGVHYIGHHDSKSFGAIPYMARGTSPSGETIHVMIDTPKYTPSAVKAVTSLTGDNGPDYLILTHTDDVGDHAKWAHHFEGNKLRRVFHSKDLEENNWIGDEALNDVEILLRGESSSNDKLQAWNLDGRAVSLVDDHDGNDRWPVDETEENVGDFLILHTPGHSPGSISLLFRSSSSVNVLFTGDTYAYTTRNNGQMTGFPRYGDNSTQQSHTLKKMLDLSYSWDVIAPGHGHLRDYRFQNNGGDNISPANEMKREEMEEALKELLLYGRN